MPLHVYNSELDLISRDTCDPFSSLQNKKKYLDILHDYVEIHATVAEEKNMSEIPRYVTNHGILNTNQLYKLLRESKVTLQLAVSKRRHFFPIFSFVVTSHSFVEPLVFSISDFR